MKTYCITLCQADVLRVKSITKITPKQQALLHGHNFHEYPTLQKLSYAKLRNNSEIDVRKIENNSDNSNIYGVR